jgi:hypothetical protein
MIIWAVRTALVQKVCINSSFRAFILATGGLVPGPSMRSSLTLGEYRKLMQTLFVSMDSVRCSLPLAPDRVTK